MKTAPAAVSYREHIVDRGAVAPVAPDVAVPLPDLTATVFRAANFPDAGPAPWLDRDQALVDVGLNQLRGTITAAEADLCRDWVRDGFVVVPKLFDDDRLDLVWGDYEAAVADGRLSPPLNPQFDGDTDPDRMLNAHFKVPSMDELLHSPELTSIVELLLGVKCFPFQSLAFTKASEQTVHSDSIHMTTYPMGYLIGVWIAFQDIVAGTGELNYYPGSHRLPYVLSDAFDLDVAHEHDQVDQDGYFAKYIPLLEQQIVDHGFEEQRFLARKGDTIFWHANLLHGGTKRTNFEAARHSIVFHYYAEGCICYHDLSGRSAWVHNAERPY